MGKSSLINNIFGKKVVSASRTPGHTKHFQTLHLSSNIRVCDSPGIIFPSIIDRNLQVLSGLYNIAQVSDPYGSILYLAQRININESLKIPINPAGENSIFYICEEFATKNGFVTSKAGRPDTFRAANYILRLVIDGKIVLKWVPSGYRCDGAQSDNISGDNTISDKGSKGDQDQDDNISDNERESDQDDNSSDTESESDQDDNSSDKECESYSDQDDDDSIVVMGTKIDFGSFSILENF